jgi:hypothetical protein
MASHKLKLQARRRSCGTLPDEGPNFGKLTKVESRAGRPMVRAKIIARYSR